MSGVPGQQSVGRQLAGRWQIPLLAVATVLLAAGLWRLRPVPQPPTFDDFFARAVALHESSLYPEASAYIEELLAKPDLDDAQRRRLHALMARVIYAHELGNAVHGVVNAQRIIEHCDAALAEGEQDDAPTLLMRARAWEWQQSGGRAVAAYQQAIAAGADQPWRIRKRIIEIQRETDQATPEWLVGEFEAFVVGEGVEEELRYWAAEQKVDLLAAEGRHADAEQFLAQHAERFKGSTVQGQYDYLQALALFHLQQFDEAERLLRVARDALVPGQPLYAKTGWLLGRIMQAYESPQPAVSFFDDVVSRTTPSPYRTLSILGRAEALAPLERFDESLAAFHEVLRLVSEDPYAGQVDLQVVRQSTTSLYEALRQAGRLPEAMAYLRIAARLAPPGDDRLQAIYTERLAALAEALGQRSLALAEGRGEGGVPADPEAVRQEARDHLIEAAEHYLQLAKLTTLDVAASTTAAWKAADAFDLAGERSRRASVLEAFIRERPDHMRVSEAMLRLGLTYQAMGEYAQAIAAYQRNLIEYPRTYWATQSLVPLAECFIDSREPDKAEQTLLRVVDRQPGDDLALIEPAAPEYRDALFQLGDLYIQSERYEQGIARYEEAIERYPEDRRADRATFMLAEAYRRSAAQIREDLKDPKKLAHKDELKVVHLRRLARAQELYQQVIERYRGRSEESLADLDRLYRKLSHFYRADTIYDRSYVLDAGDYRPFIEALHEYDEAAWLYQSDPIAMSAYVQMINCHLRMGNVYEARKTLQRMSWALRNIPDEQFEQYLPQEGRPFWEEYLSWLGRMPMFSAADGEQDSGQAG